MAYYAGLDISMKSTNICVIDEKENILLETVAKTEPDAIAQELQPFIDDLDIIGLEAGSMSFWLVEELRHHGLPAVCLDSRHVASILSTVINKTDKNDARGIAKILRSKFYTVVHQKSQKSIEIGLLMTVRTGFVNDRTRKKNRIRGTLKSYGIRISTCGQESFVKAVQVSIKKLSVDAKKVIEIALEDYVATEKGIAKLEKQVEKAEKLNPIITLFKTTDGIGPITALSFMADIDDPTRFLANPENIGAYLGLTPRQYSSGESVRLGGISKSGSSALRALLYEAAVTLLTKTQRMSPLKSWGLKLMKRMPFKQAAVAVARKLSIVLLTMWLTGKPFEYSKPKKEKITKKKKKIPVSPEQPYPILAEPPKGVKASLRLASLGLDAFRLGSALSNI